MCVNFNCFISGLCEIVNSAQIAMYDLQGLL